MPIKKVGLLIATAIAVEERGLDNVHAEMYGHSVKLRVVLSTMHVVRVIIDVFVVNKNFPPSRI